MQGSFGYPFLSHRGYALYPIRYTLPRRLGRWRRPSSLLPGRQPRGWFAEPPETSRSLLPASPPVSPAPPPSLPVDPWLTAPHTPPQRVADTRRQPMRLSALFDEFCHFLRVEKGATPATIATYRWCFGDFQAVVM